MLRRTILKATLAIASVSLAITCVLPQAMAQARKDSVVLGMVLEPPGLDPTVAPAAAIGEIVHFNIFEGLTRIQENGRVAPLLAESWSVSTDMKEFVFKLKPGVKFSDGTPLSAAEVKSSFELYGAKDSLNKRKAVFANIDSITAPDATTVAIKLKETDPNFLFSLGENTAVITAPGSRAGNATNPVGTGPYKLEKWVKGDNVVLSANAAYRDAAALRIKTVTFRFIADPAAQVAALLAGDLDGFPIGMGGESVAQFEKDKRFRVVIGTTEGETMLAINNKRKPLDDLRVRRAITHAIDRKGMVEAINFGYGTPIGSHYPPHDPAYVDLTGQYPYDPAKARALLKEAGVEKLELTLRLPPPGYARRGGEVVAAMLADVGITAKIENMEWAQWLDVVFKNFNYDLTIINHVEPNDIVKYAEPNYYWQYDSPEFRTLLAQANATLDAGERGQIMQRAQRVLARDAVNAWLYNAARIGIYQAGLKGFWANAPIFANDIAAVHWE
ncbi:ABC transporter substrate-binding protein [Ferrovibrio sp.]|uniref:ABC transporter substrate-binding protein n=1 Tax=Ferrovibrio sp. TaxID=1917215 RepID=UPI001B561CD4|nr:ABC transporter substrate-binding protein [Ferrovibrio sp.]MBP7063722.1 ABC transporter substrate-binding protein [Ferrovibrio sp.]